MSVTAQHAGRWRGRGRKLLGLAMLVLGAQANAQTCPANNPARVAPDSRYTVSEPVSGQYVVTDDDTGLMWKQCPEGLSGPSCATGSLSSMSWTAALSAANGASHAGFSDWRLPNSIELQSLVETSCWSPSINTTRFPANGTGVYWSSSTYAPGASSAWFVNFVDGSLYAGSKSISFQVRLVRGGQWLDPFASELDGEPDGFSLAAQSGVPLSSERTSDPITLAGLTTVTGIGVSGAAGSSYSINGGAFTTQPGAVANGNEVRVRHTSAATPGTATTTTLFIGGVTADFVSTTVDAPGAPTIGTATAGDGSASVAFSLPSSDGGSPITGYTAVSDPGNLTSSGCTESPCTVSGLTNGTEYTFTVFATNAIGDGPASAASNAVTPRADQAISFGTAPTVVVGGTGTVSATGGASGNPMTFTSRDTGVCTASGTNGSTVTGIAVGTCIIDANQAGSAAFNAAPQATQSFAIGQGSQTISFGTAPTVVVDGTGTVSATGGASGNPVVFSSQTTGVCTVSGSTVTGEAVGTCTIRATQAGNADYAAAAPADQSFSIGQGSQTISFGTAPTVVVDGNGTVSATGGASGNPVVFSSQTTGVCTVSGTTVTGEAVGTCTIAANQAESANYAAANEVTQSFAIGQGSQTISFAPLANKLDNDPPFSVSATGGNSGQPVTFASQTEPVCTTSGSNGSTVTLTGQLGTCTIRASQAGDVNYTAAEPVDQSFEVTASNQPPTIDLPATFTMLEDGSGSVSFTVGDDLTPAADLTVEATSGDASLISDAALAQGLGGSGPNRTLAFSPVGNENGSALITVTVTDGNGASEQAQLTLTVTPVNDPPSAAYGQNEVWPAGETGEKTAAGFVSLTSAGPGNESDQTVSIDLAIDSDPDGVLSAASIQPNGDLTYTLTGNSGAARITLQAVDDGGTVNGGVDRGEAVTRRIIVGEGIDITLSIRRGQPITKYLADALAKGSTLASYSIEVRNNSALDADGLRLQVSPIIGLTDTLWNCVISTCTPPNGSGGIDTLVDLQAGGVLLVGLSGTVDTNVPFVEITAQASLPQGVTVLLPDDDDQVFIEPSGGTGVYKSGFE